MNPHQTAFLAIPTRYRLIPDTSASALLVAIDSGHEEMAIFLLEKGANPTLNGAGRTVFTQRSSTKCMT